MATTVKELDPAVNPGLQEIEKKTGPSNLFRTMAYMPAAMHRFVELYDEITGPGSIDRRFKEMVYLAVSFVNECNYCASHHIERARESGLSDQEISDIRSETNQRFSPDEQIALRYARELTRTAAAENDTVSHMQRTFTPQQHVELTMVVALANFTNRFNNGLGVPLEKHRTAS